MLHLDFSPAQSQFLYDFFILLGCAVPPVLAWREGRLRGFPAATWLVVLALVNGLMVIGARLGAFSAADWSALFASGQWYVETPKTVAGSAVLGVLGYQLLRQWFRLPGATADAIMLGMPLGAAIGRVGCLAAGCCYGVPTDGWWSVAFGPSTSAFAAQVACGHIAVGAAESLPLHPVQVDFIVANTAIFLILWHLRKKMRPGSLAYLAFGLMAVNRFGLEFFRDVATNRGETGHIIFGLKTVQWASLALAAGSFWIFQKRQRLGLAAPVLVFREQPILRLASLIFPLSALLWAFRHRLSGLEMGLFWLAFAPAMAVIFVEVLKTEQQRWARWSSVALLSGAVGVQMVAQVDSLIAPPPTAAAPQEKARSWWEFGAGYAGGQYQDYAGGGCDAPKRARHLANQSVGFDVSMHHLEGNRHFSYGGRLSLGETKLLSGYPTGAGKYGLGGIYGNADWRGIGLAFGLLYLPENALQHAGGQGLDQYSVLPTGGLRLGRRTRYFVDFQLRERQQYLFYPQPSLSVGVFNWGFNDPTGQTNLRLGGAFFGNQPDWVWFGALRLPIWQRRLSLDAGLYIGSENEQYGAVSLGLKYHLQR